MRRPLACLAATALSIALVGCSSSAGSSVVDAAKSAASAAASAASSVASQASDTSAPLTGDSSSGASPAGADCSALTRTDLAKFIVYTQLLAQVRDKNGVAAMAAGGMADYTPQKFDQIVQKLSFLSSDPQAGPALAALQKANDTVKTLAAGSPTQADFAKYQADTGGVAGVLKDQVAVTVGLSKLCPSIT
jgi:hypothetical protein